MNEDLAWKWFKRGYKARDDVDNHVELRNLFDELYDENEDRDGKAGRATGSVTTDSGDW